MKRILHTGILLAALLLVSGCSAKFEPTEDSVYVKRNGSVIGAVIEDFDKEYYSSSEVEAEINQAVSDYNDVMGSEDVKVQSYEVAEGEARLFIEYKAAKDYKYFNGVDFFCGTVAEAQEAGYEFDAEFKDASGSSVTADEVLEHGEKKVVILEEPIQVQVSARIAYVSDNVTVLDEKLAKADMEAGLAYIIYK